VKLPSQYRIAPVAEVLFLPAYLTVVASTSIARAPPAKVATAKREPLPKTPHPVTLRLGQRHRAEARDEPAVLLITYAGTPGVPTSLPEKGEKAEY
jgi:hypothetical protein